MFVKWHRGFSKKGSIIVEFKTEDWVFSAIAETVFFVEYNSGKEYRWREVRLFRGAKKVEDATVRDSSDPVMQKHPTHASRHIQIYSKMCTRPVYDAFL